MAHIGDCIGDYCCIGLGDCRLNAHIPTPMHSVSSNLCRGFMVPSTEQDYIVLLARSMLYKKCKLTRFSYHNNPYSVCFAASAVARDSRVFRRMLDINRLCLLG